jgi:hypothetical protein
MSVLRFTDSDYPFGIFKLFLSFYSLNILKSLQSFSFTDLTLKTSRFDIINNSINSTNISTLTINLGFASANSQCLGDNKVAIPSYPVNKYI